MFQPQVTKRTSFFPYDENTFGFNQKKNSQEVAVGNSLPVISLSLQGQGFGTLLKMLK